MSAHRTLWLGSAVCALLMLHALPAAGQINDAPPIHGWRGVIALPDNVDEFYDGANRILEKTGDGLDRIFGEPDKDQNNSGEESLDHLRPGSAVVVHYAVKGIQTSPDAIGRDGSLNSAVVTKVDQSRKRITIAFANGESETLRLKESATHGGRVIVYSADEAGRKVAHYFKPVSN